METPEKIYIEVTPDGKRYYRDVVKEQKTENSDIEYTRTDAFIEKACKLLAKMVWEVAYRNPNGPNDDPVLNDTVMGFIEDFRKNMEGK